MKKRLFLISIIVAFMLASCQTFFPTENISVAVNFKHDGKTETKNIPQGSNVRQALAGAGLTLSSLDKVEPGLDELISTGETIKIIRVKEEFTVEESTLPFESQTIKNESLSQGQTLLIQAGINGIQSDTYRILSEDGIEKSRTIVKSEITQAAQPEIIMVGIQSPYKSVEIQGILAYISSSNAWVMQSTTGNRREVANSGDLDGRIFSLSPDGKWLLYSRSAAKTDTETINSLWVVNLSESAPSPIAIDAKNVVHYAEWVPGKELTIAYSTVEPRSTAPGWQANNDLIVLNFNETGKTLEKKIIIDTNPGGIYGWWGTIYAISPDASEIAYARPDSIGLVDSEKHQLNPLIEFTAYQTQGDWAWVPGFSWAQGHTALFCVLPTSNTNNDNTTFGLSAYVLGIKSQIDLQANTGMFSYPSVSKLDAQNRYRVAFLTASFPEQSSTSRYELRVMDRDGSNMKKLYPGEGIQGLDPQQVVWAPPSNSNSVIAFIAQGNMLFVDPTSGNIQQITGDGSISKIDWE
jgi:resuscitation-promoting factor RpfB